MTFQGLAAAALRRVDPERAHRLAVLALRYGPAPRRGRAPADPALRATVFGLDFPSPVCLAAGFDKSAEAWAGLLRLGCGAVEVGTLTLRPRRGNPRPRVFRLAADRAVINRYGFNNDGLDAGLARLRRRDRAAGIVGINVGIDGDARDPAAEFAEAVGRAAPLADYLAVNVSSPNTPGLRDLQAADRLDRLLGAAVAARDAATDAPGRPPLLLKIAPDVSRGEVLEIVEVAVARGAAGLIVGNTTVARPAGLRDPAAREPGGLSGPPLFVRSTRALAWAWLAADGRMPIVGAGGVDGPEAAWAKIRAGASLVQLYTALVYSGPGLFDEIAAGLAARLRDGGYASIAGGAGADAERWAERPDE